MLAPAHAQQGAPDPKTSEGQVRRYIAALIACDVATVRDIVDPQISSIGLRGAFAQSKAVYMQAVQAQCDAGVKLQLTPTILRNQEFGDVSVAALELKGTSIVNGMTSPADLRLTLVLRRSPADGVWRIVHSQTAMAL